MTEKVNITLQAATLRYKRHLLKDNKKLITFRKPIEVVGRYGVIDLQSNNVIARGDKNELLNWMAKEGVIKPYEIIEI